jgi:ribosome-binding ATPase YchF (GTP1/OBG family)
MLLGLVGRPNSGKSTFFKAATLAEVEIASYPFTTIKPNHGIGYVKVECVDKEFSVQCNPLHGFCIKGNRFVAFDLMDVAGLVKGASEGKGLGNQFLDDLRQADVFIHIVDISGTTNAEGKQTVEHDPTNDIEFLEDELNKWFHGILVKAWKSFARKIEVEEANFAESVSKQFSGLKVREDQVKKVLLKLSFSDKPSEWSDKQLMEFASELRRESKPMIIAANRIDMPRAEENYRKLKQKFPEMIVVPCSADAELALREATKKGLIDYILGERRFNNIKGKTTEKQKLALESIRENVLDKFEHGTGVQEVLNKAVFELLKYIVIFPAPANKLKDSDGNILPDSFLLPQGSTALDLAYFLHTDFGDNFIKAIDARTKKALGKNYELKNKDVLEIVTK